MSTPSPFRNLRLTKQAKALLTIAGLLLVTAPVVPYIVKLFTPDTELIETGMPCDAALWPAGLTRVTVTTPLDVGVTVTRAALVQPARAHIVYLCIVEGPR